MNVIYLYPYTTPVTGNTTMPEAFLNSLQPMKLRAFSPPPAHNFTLYLPLLPLRGKGGFLRTTGKILAILRGT